MARKSSWLPGESNLPPGSRQDRFSFNLASFGPIGPGRKPSQDITTGVGFLIGATLVAVVAFGLASNMNLPAYIIASTVILLMLGGAVYPLQRGFRRLVWGRRQEKRTGNKVRW